MGNVTSSAPGMFRKEWKTLPLHSANAGEPSLVKSERGVFQDAVGVAPLFSSALFAASCGHGFSFIPAPPLGNSGWGCPLGVRHRRGKGFPATPCPLHPEHPSQENKGTRPASGVALLGKALLPLLSRARRLALMSVALASRAKAHGRL